MYLRKHMQIARGGSDSCMNALSIFWWRESTLSRHISPLFFEQSFFSALMPFNNIFREKDRNSDLDIISYDFPQADWQFDFLSWLEGLSLLWHPALLFFPTSSFHFISFFPLFLCLNQLSNLNTLPKKKSQSTYNM